jgi:5'-3' exonuclease
MVFDGGKLQMKTGVEEDRQKNRLKYKEMAREYLKDGDEEQAMKLYGMSIDITPRIAQKVIKALQVIGIEYYVAPYEADA